MDKIGRFNRRNILPLFGISALMLFFFNSQIPWCWEKNCFEDGTHSKLAVPPPEVHVTKAVSKEKVVVETSEEEKLVVQTSEEAWEPDFIDEASVGTFQGRIPKGEKRFGRLPWGEIYEPTKLLCLVMSTWPQKDERMDVFFSTLHHPGMCDGMLFVFCENENPPSNDERMLVVWCKYPQSTRTKNVWSKSLNMWLTAGTRYLELYDWFVKLDPDSFFSPGNFKTYVQYYDPRRPWYLGHTFMHKWLEANVVFNTGAAECLSQGALFLVTPLLRHITTMAPDDPSITNNAANTCVPRSGPNEDYALAICLKEVGVVPTNTLDRVGRQRFLHWTLKKTRSAGRDSGWYWEFKPKENKDAILCCVKNLILVHHQGATIKDLLKYPEFLEKVTIHRKHKPPTPAEPLVFKFSRINPDRYLNQNPLAGQWLQHGPGLLNFTCYLCREAKRPFYGELEQNLKARIKSAPPKSS